MENEQEKKKYYKNGNPAAFKLFSEIQWNMLCERDKAMWTPYSEYEPAPISKDVIDFTKDNPEVKDCKDDKCKKLEAEVERLKKLVEELSGEVTEEVIIPEDEKVFEIPESEQKELIKARLTELGVPFRGNTGLPKLKLKLEEAENANNPE